MLLCLSVVTLTAMGLAIGLKTCSWKEELSDIREEAEFHSLVMSLEEYCSLYGQMPSSWNDLAEAGLAEVSQEKQYHLRVYCSHNDRKKVRGTEVDTRDYELRFGVGPADISVNDGNITGTDGCPVMLISPSGKNVIEKHKFISASRLLYDRMLEHEGHDQDQ